MRTTHRSQQCAAVVLALTALLAQSCASSAPSAAAIAATQSQSPLSDEFLDHLVGEWRITRTIRDTTVENTMRAEWVLGHQFVQMHMIDVKRPPAYEAIVLLGFDAKRECYIAHWCDSFGGAYSGDGFGVRSGEHIEFRFDYPDGPFFNTFTWDAAAGSWRFRGENGQADGSRTLFMEDVAVKR